MRPHFTTRHARSGLLLSLLIAGGSGAAATEAPDPGIVLAEMQDALVPATAQISRVHVTVRENDQTDEMKSWDALVVRRRFKDGPRIAITLTGPDDARGTGILTAPRADGSGGGLWIYAPSERRTREFTPLEAERHFLLTDFSYNDLALSPLPVQEPRLLGDAHIDGRAAWKVEVRPQKDVYYSRIVTWITQDTKLPLRREYYDRADRLWKVVTFRDAIIDNVPTVLAIRLDDVQTRSLSTWQVRAVSYDSAGVDREDFSEVGLGTLAAQPFWKAVSYAYSVGDQFPVAGSDIAKSRAGRHGLSTAVISTPQTASPRSRDS